MDILKPQTISLDASSLDTARVLVGQPSWEVNDWVRPETERLYRLDNESRAEAWIRRFLGKAEESKCNVVVFPELSVPEKLVPIIVDWCCKNNALAIAGSHYVQTGNDYISRCPVIYQGNKHFVEKIYPAPSEKSSTPTPGLMHGKSVAKFINTPLGNFGVLICSDYLVNVEKKFFDISDLDVLFIVSFQKNSNWYYSPLDGDINAHSDGIYIFYANNYLSGMADGHSALFGVTPSDTKKDLDKWQDGSKSALNSLITLGENSGYFVVDIAPANKIPSSRNKPGQYSNVALVQQGGFDGDGNCIVKTLKATVARSNSFDEKGITDGTPQRKNVEPHPPSANKKVLTPAEALLDFDNPESRKFIIEWRNIWLREKQEWSLIFANEALAEAAFDEIPDFPERYLRLSDAQATENQRRLIYRNLLTELGLKRINAVPPARLKSAIDKWLRRILENANGNTYTFYHTSCLGGLDSFNNDIHAEKLAFKKIHIGVNHPDLLLEYSFRDKVDPQMINPDEFHREVTLYTQDTNTGEYDFRLDILRKFATLFSNLEQLCNLADRAEADYGFRPNMDIRYFRADRPIFAFRTVSETQDFLFIPYPLNAPMRFVKIGYLGQYGNIAECLQNDFMQTCGASEILNKSLVKKLREKALNDLSIRLRADKFGKHEVESIRFQLPRKPPMDRFFCDQLLDELIALLGR